jgi:Zn-dependent protease
MASAATRIGIPMTLSTPALILLIVNMGLLWLLLAAPVGIRTIRVRRVFGARPERIWNMVHPLGGEAAWSPSLISSEQAGESGRVLQRFAHADRRGEPIRRILEVRTEEAPGRWAYLSRVVEDSALDQAFWACFREHRVVQPADGGTELIIEQTDRYRGVAFLLFRFFMIRREMLQLDNWLRNGTSTGAGMFEHPLTQVLLAVASTLLLWPFFGLTVWGLMLSSMLTVVIALHELGHMAAYRAFGHQRVRMIFIPLLGGVAIGGRPYNSLFEVALCALMGAGFSAFLVPVVIAAHSAVDASQSLGWLAGPLLVFLLVLAAFNFLNLLPMSRFDGGQVLRQVFPAAEALLGATFLVTAGFIWVGHRIGVPLEALIGALAVMALMSFAGSGSVKPREALSDMSGGERLSAGLGYYAVLLIHGYALTYACERLFA